MNKNIFILLIIIAIGVYLWKKSRDRSRIDMIDFLNANVSNAGGKWVAMDNDELGSVYKVFALVKQGVRPNETDYNNAMNTIKKYDITYDSIVNV